MGLVASVLVAVLLIGGLMSFCIVLPALGLQNWLVVLLRINAGQLGLGSLRVLNPIDFALLGLVGLTFLGLWPLLARGRKVWISIAVVLPFAGIALLLITHQAGRSAVMGAGLIVSFLMLRPPGLRTAAYLGIAANGLLLLGDFGTTGPQMPIAVVFAVGYLLLLSWFLVISVHLRAHAAHLARASS